MIEFDDNGNLPVGIHKLSWDEIVHHFGYNSHRMNLIRGLKKALFVLKRAGCKTVYLDGSFVTIKKFPKDYDCCWKPEGVISDQLDRVFLSFTVVGRLMQKIKFKGEFFPGSTIEGSSGISFLEFFQTDKETGECKGIVEIDLEEIQ